MSNFFIFLFNNFKHLPNTLKTLTLLVLITQNFIVLGNHKSSMKKALTWVSTLLKTVFYTVAVYPVFVLKNIGYHLRSPSVLLYATLFFILDRVTKLMIVNNSHRLPFPVIDNFFTITFVKNPGVAFGWFPDWRLPPILMALAMIFIISYYSLKLPEEERITRWALALLVGGAVGNLYDRVVYGFVVDFFLFHFGSFDFPVFNIADIIIDVGVFMLFVDIFFLSEDENEEDAMFSEALVN